MPTVDKHIADLVNEDYNGDVPVTESSFYTEVFNSLRSPQSAMLKLSWVGILVFGGLLIFCIIQFFGAETTRDQILYASGAILLNSAQIALKIWFNMRLNRLAIMREIKALRLALAEREANVVT